MNKDYESPVVEVVAFESDDMFAASIVEDTGISGLHIVEEEW